MKENVFCSFNSITTKVQLKTLTHMLCFKISFHEIYKKGVISCILTLKYMCHVGMNS